MERIFYTGLSTEMKEVIRMKDPDGLPYFIAAVLRMEKSAFCKVVSQAGHVEGQSNSRGSAVVRGSRNGYTGKIWDRQINEIDNNKENLQDERPQVKFSDVELNAMRREKICFKCKARGP